MRRRRPAAQPAAVSSSRWDELARWTGVALIVAAAIAIYWPALAGGFILDDNGLVTENPLVRASDGLLRIWFTKESYDYWPVTNSLFWVQWRAFGMDSQGYHIINLGLHIGGALLLWRLLARLSIPGAFWGALLWAVHPVNVESVAWISQQKTLLATAFFLLSILCYLRVSEPSSTEPTLGWHLFADRWWGMSLACFVLGMLSKGSIAILPLVLPVAVWWRRKQMRGSSRLSRADLVRIVPFLLVAVVLTYVNIRFQYHGKGEVIREANVAQRLTGAAAAVWFYLGKALWPVNLIFIYPQWDIRPTNVLWWLPLVAAILLTAGLWRMRGRWGLWPLLAWALFCLALVPMLGFTDVGFMKYSLVADHYQYISLMVATAVAGAGLAWLNGRDWSRLAPAGAVLGAVLAVSLTALARRQAETYRDPFTLYETTRARNPQCAMAEYNLARMLYTQGRMREAIPYLERAIAIQHDYSEAENNLGAALGETGHVSEGIAHIKRALEIDPDNLVAYNNLGMILLNANESQEALAQFERSIEKEPKNPVAYYGQGAALVKLGQNEQAIQRFQRAIELGPDLPEAYYHLGLALVNSGQPQSAIDPLERAIALHFREPDANFNLGVALVRLGRLQEGIERLQKTVTLQPTYASAWANLASANAGLGHRAEALTMAQKGLALARQQGQTELAQQIEAWLTAFQAGEAAAAPAPAAVTLPPSALPPNALPPSAP